MMTRTSYMMLYKQQHDFVCSYKSPKLKIHFRLDTEKIVFQWTATEL